MRYVPPSIREKGLRNHLVEVGIDPDLFIRMVEKDMPIATIAKFFGKATPTVRNWIEVYRWEQK